MLTQISEIKIVEVPDVDLSKVGVTKFGSLSVEVIDQSLTIWSY